MPPGTPGRVRSILLVVWCLMLDLFVCFKGPTACYSLDPRPRFRALFWSFFFWWLFGAKWSSPWCSKSLKIGKKSCSRGLPESTLEKDTKNDRKSHFPGRLHMQSAHACAVQTHFFVFTFQWPKAPKKSQKASQNGAFGHSKSQKNQKNEHSKKH